MTFKLGDKVDLDENGKLVPAKIDAEADGTVTIVATHIDPFFIDFNVEFTEKGFAKFKRFHPDSPRRI